MHEISFERSQDIRHAYILSSPSEEVAYSQAIRIAQAAVCRGSSPFPCGNCSSCRKTFENKHPDVLIIERLSDDKGKKKKEILVSQIRDISVDVAVLPNEAPRKVYIIREAETMNEEAQNAALKLLEEAPNGALFVLCTSNPVRLLPTVRSRCIELNFSSDEDAADDEIKSLSDEYLKRVSGGNAFAVWQFCEENNSLSIQEMTAFCLCTAQTLTDMLCLRESSLGMSVAKMLSLEQLMEKCLNYLKVNVNVKQVFGLLETAWNG